MKVYFLGRASYQDTCALQERLRSRVLAGGPEVILLCEHDPVLTLGRSATDADILAGRDVLSAHGIAVHRSSRGGQVTYHGPGQLVIYPIVRLKRGIVAHVDWLAGAAIDLAASHGLQARFDREHVGVWLGNRKLAAIGVHVSRRVTIHGMAINIRREATQPFSQRWFVPCGNPQGQAISLQGALADAEGAQTGSDTPPQADAKMPVAPPPDLTIEAAAQRLAPLLLRRAQHELCEVELSSVALLSEALSVE